MRLRLSITRRLIVGITALVVILFGAVLFVIRGRVFQALYRQARTEALLNAQYMKQENLQPLSRRDWPAIEDNIDQQVGDQLPYIVFYDRSGEPKASNPEVRTREDILGRSSLREDVRADEEALVAERRVELQGHSLRILEVEVPIFFPGNETKSASVKIGRSLEPMYAVRRNISAVIILVGLGGILLGILGASVLANRITRPLHKLVDGTVRISRGDFSRTIDIPPGDEIGELARSFNEMTGQLLQTRERMDAANRRLVQAEKLASIGRLAATIAHEIRNPLTSVKLNIQKVAEDQRLDEAEREHVGLSLEGIVQIEKFIKELLNYTRVADLNLERFPLEQVFEESFKVLKDSLARKGIRVERDFAPGLPPVLVDGDKMRQVFLNILRNAEEALEAGGRIDVAMDAVVERGQRKLRVRISDDGSGIPEKDRDNIFEPFFTTKPSGFGLGLANARKIVEQHNGSVRLARKRARGTSFVILIPCEEEA
jgi:signal transduction histidine kinase